MYLLPRTRRRSDSPAHHERALLPGNVGRSAGRLHHWWKRHLCWNFKQKKRPEWVVMLSSWHPRVLAHKCCGLHLSNLTNFPNYSDSSLQSIKCQHYTMHTHTILPFLFTVIINHSCSHPKSTVQFHLCCNQSHVFLSVWIFIFPSKLSSALMYLIISFSVKHILQW